MKKKNFYFILFLIFLFFSFLNKKYLLKQFLFIKENLSINYRVVGSFFKTINLEKCNINQIFSIPPNSTLIIGHAYGNQGII